MSLTSILKEIQVNKPNAEMNVTMDNPNTYNGRLGLKKAAMESLKKLKVDYRNALLEGATFIIVTGNGRDKFNELATNPEAFGCFSVDPNQFFNDLASRIDSRLYGRENTRNLFNVADKVLYDKAIELDIQSYPTLRFNETLNISVQTKEEFVPVIRSAIAQQVGLELVGIDAVHTITDLAINKNHDAGVTPIVLNTSDEKFAMDLENGLKKKLHANGTYTGLTHNVFLVVAGKGKPHSADALVVKTVNEESVGAVLSTIRNKILV